MGKLLTKLKDTLLENNKRKHVQVPEVHKSHQRVTLLSMRKVVLSQIIAMIIRLLFFLY